MHKNANQTAYQFKILYPNKQSFAEFYSFLIIFAYDAISPGAADKFPS